MSHLLIIMDINASSLCLNTTGSVFSVFKLKTSFHLVPYFRQFDENICSNSGGFPLSDVTKLSLSIACDPMGYSFNIIRGTCCEWLVHGQFLFKTFL